MIGTTRRGMRCLLLVGHLIRRHVVIVGGA